MHKMRVLATLEFGSVYKCNCCAEYDIALVNLSVHLNQFQMVALFNLILAAFEADGISLSLILNRRDKKEALWQAHNVDFGRVQMSITSSSMVGLIRGLTCIRPCGC